MKSRAPVVSLDATAKRRGKAATSSQAGGQPRAGASVPRRRAVLGGGGFTGAVYEIGALARSTSSP